MWIRLSPCSERRQPEGDACRSRRCNVAQFPPFRAARLGVTILSRKRLRACKRSENKASTCEEPLPSVSFASSPASSLLSRLDTRLARARTMPGVRHYLDLGHLRRLECVAVLVSLAPRS